MVVSTAAINVMVDECTGGVIETRQVKGCQGLHARFRSANAAAVRGRGATKDACVPASNSPLRPAWLQRAAESFGSADNADRRSGRNFFAVFDESEGVVLSIHPRSRPPGDIMNRRSLAAVLAISLLGLTSVAQALEIRPFDTAALTALQGAGKPVAVHFHADWCPTCVNQSRALDQLKTGGQLQGMTVLVADYDKENELKRQLKVRSQSVLVVFKGTAEVARSAGQSKPEQLREALAKAL
ncbi:MAG: thioredoxin family protein [Betaproteobacteria bacterium]